MFGSIHTPTAYAAIGAFFLMGGRAHRTWHVRLHALRKPGYRGCGVLLLLTDYDDAQDGAYGFDDPTLVATLSYTTTSEEETGEVDDSGEAITETVETPCTFVLTVGAQTDEDDYYAMVEGSSKVYTIAQSDVESLLEASVDSLRDDSVCLMDWDTVDAIDISFGDQTKTLAITRTEETDDDGNTETVASYTLDGESLEDIDAEELLDAIDALESEGEGNASAAAEKSPALSFVFHRSTDAFSEMTLSFTRYDNSFYLVSFNGEKRLLVNRNAVTDLVDMVSDWQPVHETAPRRRFCPLLRRGALRMHVARGDARISGNADCPRTMLGSLRFSYNVSGSPNAAAPSFSYRKHQSMIWRRLLTP